MQPAISLALDARGLNNHLPVCFHLSQKIEIDPVKFAADLESYEDLKRRLVRDTAIFGAVGALVAFEVGIVSCVINNRCFVAALIQRKHVNRLRAALTFSGTTYLELVSNNMQ